MFERTLQDLIRGLRAHKASSKTQEDVFIHEAMLEIREELKGKDMALKGEGVIKMCYLMMLYPIPPPPGFAFHVVEVMSSPRFHLKQLGYLAAPMAFSSDSEEIVLTVNGMKKDLLAPHLPLPPLPLNALPQLLSLSPSLSQTLHPDLLHLLTHSSARIRKRAVLCLLQCWETYPDGLKEGFPRLRERLQDEDQGVVGAAVGVVMELARRHGGKNYLPLAPELFSILTGSSNNWMLIKVVKLFAILTPLEPRLVRKLLAPITSLISSTSAISLLYECVRTCIIGGMLDPDRPEGEALARVCVEKLGGYLRDEGGDQNLRYIALLAMVKITPTHPHMVAEYREEILQSLDDPDVSIRMRALELVTSMVDEDNIRSVVDRLLAHLTPSESVSAPLPSAAASLAALQDSITSVLAPEAVTSAAVSLSPAYRLFLTRRLLSIIHFDTFRYVTDFQWALSVLVDVAYISNVDVGTQLKEMTLDIVGRVRSIRSFAVRTLEKGLSDERLREDTRWESGAYGIIEAAIWVCGEYPDALSSPLSTVSSLMGIVEQNSTKGAAAIQAIAKIFGQQAIVASERWTDDRQNEIRSLVNSIRSGLSNLRHGSNIEVQERSFELLQLLNFVDADLRSHTGGLPDHRTESDDGLASGTNPPYPKSLFLLGPLSNIYELNAVGITAQEAVALPEGLNLDSDFIPGGGFPGDLETEEDLPESDVEDAIDLGVGGGKGMDELRRVIREQEAEDKALRKGRKSKGKARRTEGESEVREIKAEKQRRKAVQKQRAADDPYYLYDEKVDPKEDSDLEQIPIVRLDDLEMSEERPESRQGSMTQEAVSGRTSRADINRTGEMPEHRRQAGENGKHVESIREGLAGMDLPPPAKVAFGSSSRFEEYKVDEADGTPGADTPGVDSAGVEVVKVKRKKKKDGEKRRIKV